VATVYRLCVLVFSFSAFALVLTLILWAGSGLPRRTVVRVPGGPYEITADPGRLVITSDAEFGADVYQQYGRVERRLGFGYGTVRIVRSPNVIAVARRIEVPFWTVIVLLLATMVWSLRGARRRYARMIRGRGRVCPVCGYDLRATPGRCPECGWGMQTLSGGRAP
jgi:hypothetical protein